MNCHKLRECGFANDGFSSVDQLLWLPFTSIFKIGIVLLEAQAIFFIRSLHNLLANLCILAFLLCMHNSIVGSFILMLCCLLITLLFVWL